MVKLASFQLLADTGRGILGSRDSRITIASVERQIELGAGTPLSFDTARAGHAHCNRYAMTLVISGKVYDMLDDRELFDDILAHTVRLQFDRQSRFRAVRTLVGGILTSPRLMLRAAVWLIRKLWRAKPNLLRAHGHVDKLSFFIHNFMDACSLEKDRIDACIFTTATGAGPISMCLHNAKRDAFVLHPVRMGRADGDRFWDPRSGRVTPEPMPIYPATDVGRKLAKGRLKRAMAATRPAKR
ncbi:MAG: hypothetical protein ACRD9W_23270 [Terriglobia bacterium]